jgi:predicted nucleic acid-binding protein
MPRAPKISSARIETTATASRAVLDASVVVGALVYETPAAVGWIERIARDEVQAVCPSLLYAEVGNAVLMLHRAGELTARAAQLVLDTALAAPFEAQPIELLALPAWTVAAERGLSIYDAFYAVLAETRDAVLVTADRRLAEATPNAVLITA